MASERMHYSCARETKSINENSNKKENPLRYCTQTMINLCIICSRKIHRKTALLEPSYGLNHKLLLRLFENKQNYMSLKFYSVSFCV